MNPIWRALLGPWEWRLEVLVVLLPLTVIYLVGWARIRRVRGARGADSRLATGWRLAAYLAGMATLMISLMSPIDTLGGQLFFMHMIQHKLSIMVAAPLLWLGNPFPIGLWGLPAPVRRGFSHVLSDASPVRPLLETVTQPFVV
ncbi:MAG: cytochrome c oxidase assembly protein, partial [Caldilineaceae bacterium]